MEYSKEDLMEAKKQIWGVGENMGTEESKKIWEENASDSSLSMGEVMILILLGFEPLITSLFSFVSSYGVSVKRKVAHIQALYRISLRDELDRECVKLCELRADMAFDHAAHDREQLQALNNLIDAETEEVVVRSRRKLAEHEGSPEAVTYLLEGGYSQPQPEESCCGSTSKWTA